MYTETVLSMIKREYCVKGQTLNALTCTLPCAASQAANHPVGPGA